MRVASLLISATALAVTVLSDGNAIRNAIKIIDRDTTDLGNTVSSWPGSLLGAVPIAGKADDLRQALEDGAHTAEVSAPLSYDEAVAVYQATGELNGTVNKTLSALIAAKPKFGRLPFGTTIMLNTLNVQRGAAKGFSNKVLTKVPKELQLIAKQIVKGIDDSFERVIDAYH